MQKEDYKIHIIGAGVSGLIAARVLENHGYAPTILEASDRVGGRVKTEHEDGFVLDHGFQVLLTAYPKAKEYLDFEALKLEKFLPGAVIFGEGSKQTIGDPLRNLSLLFPTILASVGTISDKLKVLKLNIQLKKKSLEEIFDSPEKTTYDYLNEKGFSKGMIEQFFKPFFSGIFLEPNLETSSRMFEFVYKMFGEGYAAVPHDGIEAISQQLKAQLKQTTFKFNTAVRDVQDDEIKLVNGTNINSHFSIIATEASSLVSNLSNQQTSWKGCDSLYFEVENKVLDKPVIGLISAPEALINNLNYPKQAGATHLLSVTVVKDHALSIEDLKIKVVQELKQYCGISVKRFIKHYMIKKGLPKLTNLQYSIDPTETQLKEQVFLAGDILLNGSLNAAMIAGEAAAMGVIKNIEENVF
ncbi:FAD-dependent oxidoreductase [Gangjinia marincola]